MSGELIELPEGWEWASVEELASLMQYGTSAKTSEQLSDGIPVLRMGNIIDGDLDFANLKYLPKDHDEFPNLLLESGDVLFNRTNSAELVGKTAVYKDSSLPCSFASYLIRIRLSAYEPDLFSWYLNSTFGRKWIASVVSQQVGQANVSGAKLKALQIPVPPLNEQKRIVATIEELRERSQKAREALTAIPGLCDKFRQSVLAAAFRGDLTADWREQNPDVEWKEVTLGEIIKSKPRNGYSPKPVDFPTKVKSLTLSATTSGKFKPEHFKYINEDIEPDSYLWLNPGDILIQRSNTLDYVGTCAIYDGNFGEFIYPDLMMKIQVVEEKAEPAFVYYALSSQATKQYFKENATGTAGNMPKINQQVVMNTPITLPSISEQVEIVQCIQQAFNAINRISLEYEKAREKLNLFDRSILAKAFQGELVEQDPNDESASVLLERIRAEREQHAQGKTKKQGRKRKQVTDS